VREYVEAPSAKLLMRIRLANRSGTARTYNASVRPLSASNTESISPARPISKLATSIPRIRAASFTLFTAIAE
jgi:hypothetical protein